MNVAAKPAPAPSDVLRLHHFAYRCRDAEETRQFYEDVLGLPLVHVVKESTVPSTGEKTPFVHLFFELKDGSCIAFFDLGDNVKPAPSPNTPAWVNHLALKVPSVKDVEIMKARLEATRHQCRRRHRSWFRQVDLFLRSERHPARVYRRNRGPG